MCLRLTKLADNYNDLGYNIENERYYRTLCKRGPRALVVFLTRVGEVSLGKLIERSNIINSSQQSANN